MEKLKIDYGKEVRQPFIDAVSGLFNNGFFQMCLELEILDFTRTNESMILAFLDINDFAGYNKRCGVLKGELLLKSFAGIITENTRKTDIAARYSGDQFVLLLKRCKLVTAEKIFNNIIESVNKNQEHDFNISIGFSEFSNKFDSKIDFFEACSRALHQAKMIGGKKPVCSSPIEVDLAPKGSNILVVDDNLLNLKLIKGLLSTHNYEVTEADRGSKALTIVQNQNIDLVFLDVMMPELDGFEVCRRIKSNETTRMIPVVLLTALNDMQSKIEGIEAGADDFITKPPNSIEILARTKSLINIKKLNSNLVCIEHVLFSIANIVESKDTYTHGHIDRVSSIAVALGRMMERSEEEKKALLYGGILHDIGKIGVDNSILNKNGKLSPDEWEKMKKHSRIGYEIIRPLENNLGLALDIILHHHETLDGKGYPDGLKGEEINMTTRIMTVVDIYDALVTDRPYRKALSKQKALSILDHDVDAGKLDKDVVLNLKKLISD